MPGWVSILPAALAIVVALLFRNVIPALLIGLWLGATALVSFARAGILRGLLNSFQVHVTTAMADRDRVSIVLFTMMIGGMVGISTRNGGMASIVYSIVSRAKTAVGGQVAVWLMGMMIFFDDYSNTLVVGNTARSLTDHLRISREKLDYIVDSTAAPIACIALITTWIGYEIGLIQDALNNVPELRDLQAYSVFLKSVPYSFYPIIAIFFVLMVAVSGRDFGSMYRAEQRARAGQALFPPVVRRERLRPHRARTHAAALCSRGRLGSALPRHDPRGLWWLALAVHLAGAGGPCRLPVGIRAACPGPGGRIGG